MPVNQSIQKFYSKAAGAAGADFSRDFLFRVTQMQLQGIPFMSDDDLVYVKTASLPGRNITNVAVPYMGLNINVPGAVTYPGSDSYALQFYLDANSVIRSKFEQASRALFNENGPDGVSGGQYGTPDGDNFIQLEQLDKNLNSISVFKLVGASLRNIDSIAYNIADGTGATVELNATFAYHYYETIAQAVVVPEA